MFSGVHLIGDLNVQAECRIVFEMVPKYTIKQGFFFVHDSYLRRDSARVVENIINISVVLIFLYAVPFIVWHRATSRLRYRSIRFHIIKQFTFLF